jgi:hypothetical protein
MSPSRQDIADLRKINTAGGKWEGIFSLVLITNIRHHRKYVKNTAYMVYLGPNPYSRKPRALFQVGLKRKYSFSLSDKKTHEKNVNFSETFREQENFR